jgi:hypothetical protein
MNVVARNNAIADANENDLTGSVQTSADPPRAKSDSALAVPVVATPAVAKPQPAKRVRHARRSRRAPAPAQADGLATQGGTWSPTTPSYTSTMTPSVTGSIPPSSRAKRQLKQVPVTGQNKSAAQASYAAQRQPTQTTPPVSGFPNAQY